ncbi:MAG: DUF1015 domain-containing protein [Candidatus Rokubacteria bacterium]|nr:DUF1015 domain-containing protein [Candidatus Rokubacteria bacterium]MBI2554031.1 DUF1015 domain-containing protein [Candidatus Rokubacteria bacterium]
MKIRPVRGYRYNPAKVPDLSRVVAPPYDQIDAEARDALYALHPWNFVRVTLGRPEPGDAGDADRHRRARECLDRWTAEQVLVRDAEPALYPVLATYQVGGETLSRMGFICLGALTEYDEGVVLPHERTHAGPKVERLAHLEATGADTGVIFMLASDPSGELLRAAASPPTPPVAAARDGKGELHQLWRIADPAAIARVQALVADTRLIIADGHHRYETALEYRRRHPGAEWKLMAIFPLEAPGVTICPTHRLLHDVPGFDVEALLARAARWFQIERAPASADPVGEARALVVALDARVRAGSLPIAVVAGGEGPGWLLTLRPEAFDAVPWPAGTSPAWRRLAVSVLHEGLLKPCVGITEEILRRQVCVDYTADAAEAVTQVREGNYQAGFLIAPTTPAELQAVVRAGELLPQKSTFFYPKLLDGLVFHRLSEGDGA